MPGCEAWDEEPIRSHPADWPTAAAAVQTRWEHGHDQLTPGCAVCNIEFADAMTAAQNEEIR